MDLNSSDLEFFDFKNSSDEEIKEIQAILKGPGSNGCVELPWEISVSDNSVEGHPETEVIAEADLALPTKSVEEVTINLGLNYTQSPTAQLPPTMETFVTLPTTVGPYQNAPYFVSRTIPYLRAYPPMGVPFFACPLPPGTGEASPYGQFVPVTAAGPEAGSESSSDAMRQADKRNEEPAVPLVPSFAVAGYPPGLHTLPPYAGQSMYYVPVFNHPYGGYHLPSPPIPVITPETTDLDDRVVEIDGREKPGSPSEHIVQTEVSDTGSPAADCEPFKEATSNVQPDCHQVCTPLAKTSDSSPSSSNEGSSVSYLQEAQWNNCPPEPVAPSLCLQKTVASNDCQPQPVCPVQRTKVNENPTGSLNTVLSNNYPSEPVVHTKVIRDPSRCWADLFKGEVNGIDPQRSTLKKDVTNGKVCSMPVNH